MKKLFLPAISMGFSLVILSSVLACGGDGKPDPDPEPSRADSIALSPDTVTFDAVAATAQVSATVLDQYGDPMTGQTILWAADNPLVASVDVAGIITSEGDGVTLVRAQAGTVRGSVYVEVTQEPADIESLAGDGQLQWTGFVLGDPLEIRITDGQGTAMAGIPVTWGVTDGDGVVAPLAATTDQDGEVSALWQLGAGESGVQRAFATSADLDSIFFSATGSAPIELMNGSALSGTMLDTLTATLLTLDSLGMPQSGTPLEFSEPTGFGTIAQGPTATDINGELEVRWALGPTPGPQTVTVGRGDIDWTLDLSAQATGTLDPWPFVSVAPGFYHTCALDNMNSGFCWGTNEQSQLGTADTLPVLTPAPIPQAFTWSELESGEIHTCGLISPSGAIRCWGTGFQTGQGIDDVVPGPALVPGGPWTTVSVGGNHTCALKGDGTAWCWGQDLEGRLGTGEVLPTGTATPVTGGLAWSQISAGHFHSCGLVDPGTAYCWGRGEFGELGNGLMADQVSPVMVAGGITWTKVAAGRFHTCGISTQGDAYCWGEGEFNQLGNTSRDDQTSPTKVAGSHSWMDIAVGQYHTCGIDSFNKLYCWGRERYVGLGNFGSPIPAIVLPPYNWQSVTTQGIHSCAVTLSGETYCWGPNGSGQLGIGTTENSFVPRIVIRGVSAP